MFILELQNKLEVTTPKGIGHVFLVTDYGTETPKLYTVIQNNGELWEWRPQEIKVKDNVTFGRKSN